MKLVKKIIVLHLALISLNCFPDIDPIENINKESQIDKKPSELRFSFI